MGDGLIHLIPYVAALVVLIILYRGILRRHQAAVDQASQGIEYVKKGEVREQRKLALAEETLALQRETNELLLRLLEKP
jgi:hypothetical protein